MIVIIDNGDERLLERLPDRSADLIIFIPRMYDLATVYRLWNTFYKKTRTGGNIIIAENLPAAFTAL